MADKIQSVKGMHDILQQSSSKWQTLENRVQGILNRYGYQEIRTPVVEKTELFKRSIGETTDIVSKEMYTFTDLGGESLTLRPEGTAGTVRALLQHGLYQNSPLRLWYCGLMFRHERPQKGRLRQFNQIGAEVYGLKGPDIDAELIAMCARFWKELGIDNLELQINTLGSNEARRKYRDVLVEFFQDHKNDLDDDSQIRLEKNPLRILDSKNPEMQALIEAAPGMAEHMDEQSGEHFLGLQNLLGSIGIPFTLNPRLVRGLDYYSNTVFEWVSDSLGAQGTVCAGGRYDGLLEHFGGRTIPAIGFAMGLERLVELMSLSDAGEKDPQSPHVYLIIAGDSAFARGFQLAEELKDALPELRLLMHCGGGSFKSQFKKADKSGADIALILGEDELDKQCVGLKHLRGENVQSELAWTDLADRLKLELGL
ncbi:MAG: histidine--tRNA ligase [Gammaproteobacteria bacterium]|nr:histidine--tRNA ligase [Gammaproteobacteria bacterium]